MIYENMNALVAEFLDRATNKQCGTYKLPEHTCRTWTHDKGKKYHYHNSGVYPDQSTLYFFDDNYNHVYQNYFDSNMTVTWTENAGGFSNYPQPITLDENVHQQHYTYEAVVDSSSTTSNSVSYTNSVTVGVKVKVGTDDLSVEGSTEITHSQTNEHSQSDTTGQSSKGIYTFHWDESPEVYPEGFELWWGVNNYQLKTNPAVDLVTTYTVDATNGFKFAINCGYKREGSGTHHTTLFVTLKPSDLGYTSNEFKVKVPTTYKVDYRDSFPTIIKKPIRQ